MQIDACFLHQFDKSNSRELNYVAQNILSWEFFAQQLSDQIQVTSAGLTKICLRKAPSSHN